ncbi:MAG: type 1 glutamine amidotransferase, partial [Nitrospiria bacterium]
KLLLLQIRNHTDVRKEEHSSFVKYSGLRAEQIEILNVFDTPDFPQNIINDFDALFVGGASEASVLEPGRYRFIKASEALLLYCIDQTIPVFASCFGFQLAVRALGGEIIRDVKNFEMGTIPIHLTDLAKTDPIFENTSNPFIAVSVHQERAVASPSNCETLAYTEQCCHAFKVTDKPFWAFQFHPELDYMTLVKRLSIYSKKYTENNAHLQAVLNNAQETPESNQLVANFVNRVLT